MREGTSKETDGTAQDTTGRYLTRYRFNRDKRLPARPRRSNLWRGPSVPIHLFPNREFVLWKEPRRPLSTDISRVRRFLVVAPSRRRGGSPRWKRIKRRFRGAEGAFHSKIGGDIVGKRRSIPLEPKFLEETGSAVGFRICRERR